MLALAIFGIIFATYLLTALVVVVVYESMTVSQTPKWLEKVYNVLTFNWR